MGISQGQKSFAISLEKLHRDLILSEDPVKNEESFVSSNIRKYNERIRK
jgi:hypothetical protein